MLCSKKWQHPSDHRATTKMASMEYIIWINLYYEIWNNTSKTIFNYVYEKKEETIK